MVAKNGVKVAKNGTSTLWVGEGARWEPCCIVEENTVFLDKILSIRQTLTDSYKIMVKTLRRNCTNTIQFYKLKEGCKYFFMNNLF